MLLTLYTYTHIHINRYTLKQVMMMEQPNVSIFQAAVIRAFVDKIGRAPVIVICGDPDTNQISLQSNLSEGGQIESILMDLLKSAKAEQITNEFQETITNELEEPPENDQE